MCIVCDLKRISDWTEENAKVTASFHPEAVQEKAMDLADSLLKHEDDEVRALACLLVTTFLTGKYAGVLQETLDAINSSNDNAGALH